MDIAGQARKLERKISRTIHAAVDEFVGRSTATPLEIVHAVLDRAEQQIQEIGRGQRIFPFPRVRVHVVAASKDKEVRARFASEFEGPPSLSERLTERLRSCGCSVREIDTEVVFARSSGAGWTSPDYHVDFERMAVAASATPPPEPAPPE